MDLFNELEKKIRELNTSLKRIINNFLLKMFGNLKYL